MKNKEPLSPHIQIYRWHVSSLVSISNRITGIINIIATTLICLWVSLLFLGENNYETINLFLIMDLGYGFELKTTKIIGLSVIFGSVILTIILYLVGKNFI